jgi:short-subunit dehydrogenase
MKKKELKDQWALVTGASGGLGADIARELASLGMNIVLTARNLDALDGLADELRARFGVATRCVPADLSQSSAAEPLFKEATAGGLNVSVLINNAGSGCWGGFDEIEWEKERAMLNLDIASLVHLTKLAAAHMKRNRFGLILQTASIGAFQPSPLYASYSAAKAFVLSYGLAVNYELKGTGVSCTVLNPGVTATGFFERAGQTMTAYQRAMVMPSSRVARIAINALIRRRWSVVPGFANKLGALLTRLISRPAAAAIAYQAMK